MGDGAENRSACYSLSIPSRRVTHAADCFFTQFNASRPSLKVSTSSIVPSGHSASTIQCSPSLRTTQKIGVRAVTFSPALKCWGDTATTLQRACDLALDKRAAGIGGYGCSTTYRLQKCISRSAHASKDRRKA
jgi:hypothetical protein